MRFKAAIFDLDGTLLDTLEDLADSMNCVLSRSGYPIHEKDAYKYFVGNGLRNLVKRALPENFRTDEIIDRNLQEMHNEYNKRSEEKTKPYAGIAEMLDFVTKSGIKMSILSNKADYMTKDIVCKLLSKWNFEYILGERSNVSRKPDPAGALEISRGLSIPSEDFIYLGDTAVDMQTAVAAGMYPVGVLWGFRKADELKQAGAKALLTKPEDLIALLNELQIITL